MRNELSLPVKGGMILAALQGLILPVPTLARDKKAPKRLNIIHIMSDDHSYQAISAYGHPLSAHAPTPNMDRLASEGIRFDRAYVENSLSTPSRACLMTGLYSHQNGQRTLGKGIDSTVTFVTELLQGGGYQTAVVGKWHMQCEPKGFDYYYILRGQGEYYNPVFKSHLSGGKYEQEDGYVTSLVTEHAWRTGIRTNHSAYMSTTSRPTGTGCRMSGTWTCMRMWNSPFPKRSPTIIQQKERPRGNSG